MKKRTSKRQSSGQVEMLAAAAMDIKAIIRRVHRDIQFFKIPRGLLVNGEQEHNYGETVHLVGNSLSLGMLAKLSSKNTVQPEINRLVTELYRPLLHIAIANEFPLQRNCTVTRMITQTPAAVWKGMTTATRTPAVVVALARAGLLPSQIAFDFLTQVLNPANVRQDHLHLGRTVGSGGGVTGAGLHAAKIGGPIEGTVMIIPDPMGATGSTVTKVLDHYRSEVAGTALKIIAVHLIITPEYLKHISQNHPEVIVYALRLDRGLSSDDVLDTIPGERWNEERGLDDHGYIVPGAGGLGEIMNNSFV